MNDTEQTQANSTQHRNVTEAAGRLLASIDQSNGTDDEKVAAKSKIAGLLHGAITAVEEGGPRALIERFKS